MYEKLEAIEQEIGKVIKGKKDVIQKVLMAICASGHVLLEDHPGSGKTTLAKAIAKAMELDYNRQQFTPDTMPSDIIGYSFYNKQKEEFQYVPGVVQCNLLLGDEILIMENGKVGSWFTIGENLAYPRDLLSEEMIGIKRKIIKTLENRSQTQKNF